MDVDYSFVIDTIFAYDEGCLRQIAIGPLGRQASYQTLDEFQCLMDQSGWCWKAFVFNKRSRIRAFDDDGAYLFNTVIVKFKRPCNSQHVLLSRD